MKSTKRVGEVSMRWFYKFSLRVRSLFRKGRVEQELSDELRFHLGKLIEEKVGKGMTPEEARYAALRELGGVEQVKEECRDMRRVNYIENFFQDLRFRIASEESGLHRRGRAHARARHWGEHGHV